MLIANGAELLAMMPVYGPESATAERYFVIVAKTVRPREFYPDEWVCAFMTTLDDGQWYWGNYYGSPQDALADMKQRAVLGVSV